MADVDMQFSGNSYNGEGQIRQTLAQRQKFTTETSDLTFPRKCEDRLFTKPHAVGRGQTPSGD